MHKAYDEKMTGTMEGHFHFNSTGWEDSYHTGMFGGLFGKDMYMPHLENKVSHFREDVALNAAFGDFLMSMMSMMSKEKHNSTSNKWGEIMYFKNQQLLARYCLERIALNMPSVD
ncbi:hypothetical protein, partial [Neisseria meningitidis]|uniref:hypothetical protein n=1 Tax=Neisseria meningitidis TaxID=487 RepID=UPI00214C59F7